MKREPVLTVPCPVQEIARRDPDLEAIRTATGAISYGGLDERVNRAAARLRALGCGVGDRVGLVMPNGEEYMVLLLALWRIGGVACPISTRLPERGIAEALHSVRARLLVTAEDQHPSHGAGLPVVVPGEILFGPAADGERGGEQMKTDQPAAVVFTSGSAGRAKAALLTWGNLYYNALGSNQNIPLGTGDRWLLSLPLYHVGGLGIPMRCFLAGAAVALPERGTPIGRSIADLGVTHVSMVTTQLVRLLRQGDAGQLAGLRAILLGGSAFPSALLEEARARLLPVYTSYGLTEMASQVTTTSPDADALELTTSGRLLPFRDLHISGEGEILVRGETLFQGYLDGEDLYRPFDADGWFHTGDLGVLDARHNLTVFGRRDNMFISGGENIQPEEIEQVLCRFEGVEQAVVVPVPDAEFGFRPVAFVLSTQGRPRSSELLAGLSGTLPKFKMPVAFFDLAYADTGERMKVDRKELARQAAAELRRS